MFVLPISINQRCPKWLVKLCTNRYARIHYARGIRLSDIWCGFHIRYTVINIYMGNQIRHHFSLIYSYIYIYIPLYNDHPIIRLDSHEKLYWTVFGKPSNICYIGQFWNEAPRTHSCNTWITPLAMDQMNVPKSGKRKKTMNGSDTVEYHLYN